MYLVLPAHGASARRAVRMAYVEGYPGEKTKDVAVKHLAFIIIVIIMITGIMLFHAEDWKADISRIGIIVGIITAIIVFVSYKVNPLGWKRLFKKTDYDNMLRLDRMVADELNALDDNYYIFNDLTFELFHIQNFVISKYGIFVVSKIRENETLSVRKEVLFAGDNPLDTLTGNLWRVCHLVNIVFKKGFKEEIMPKPILVAPEAASVAVKEHDGITVIPLVKLNETIEKETQEIIDLDLVQSFAYFIKKRYT